MFDPSSPGLRRLVSRTLPYVELDGQLNVIVVQGSKVLLRVDDFKVGRGHDVAGAHRAAAADLQAASFRPRPLADRMRMPLTLRRISMTSSFTPGMAMYSCTTSPIFTQVTAGAGGWS